MIDLYTWKTPNGRKVSVMLEECGLRYNAHAVDIGKGEQFTPQFLALSPNGKIPAIADSDGPDGKAHHPVRIGRDPGLPRRKDGQIPARVRP